MEDLVVVILVNYNQNEYTLKCINSLLESDYDNYKIVLVDNGSTQNNADRLFKKLPINDKLLFRRLVDNIGYAEGTNCGLSEGIKMDPDFFLIMNNDTIVDKYAIKELVKTCNDYDKKVIVTGKVYDYDEPNLLQIVGYQLKNRKLLTYKQMGMNIIDEGQFDKIEERDMIDDIFVLQPVNIYKTIGGYSPYLWVNGVNIDMALRAKEIGYRLIYTPDAKLWHKGSISIGGRNGNPKLAYWNIQSSLIIRYLYLSKINFFVYYIMVLNSIIRTYFRSIYLKLFKGEDILNYARAKYRGLFYFNKWIFIKKENNGNTPF